MTKKPTDSSSLLISSSHSALFACLSHVQTIPYRDLRYQKSLTIPRQDAPRNPEFNARILGRAGWPSCNPSRGYEATTPVSIRAFELLALQPGGSQKRASACAFRGRTIRDTSACIRLILPLETAGRCVYPFDIRLDVNFQIEIDITRNAARFYSARARR